MNIRIGIVDEHDIVRESLKVFLETCDDFVFVGEASTGQETVALCAQTMPDVLLFDFLSDDDCFSLLKLLRRLHPQMKILMLTTNLHPQYVLASLEVGVFGYLFKQLDIDELAAAIRTVHAGGRLFDREVEEIIAAQANRASLRDGFFNFVTVLALGLGLLPMGHIQLSSD